MLSSLEALFTWWGYVHMAYIEMFFVCVLYTNNIRVNVVGPLMLSVISFGLL